MRVREIRIIGSVLSRELGWGWPLFLLNCVARKRSLFSDTHWAKDEGPESQFANRLSISAAIYLALVERLGKDRAFEMMREILVPIGCEEQMSNVTSLEVPSDDPMDRLWAFYDFMGQGGVGRFVQRTIVRSDELFNLLSSQLGFDASMESVATAEVGNFTWDFYEFQIQAYPVDLALAERGGRAYFVLLVSPEDERDALYQKVFLPVVQALGPLEQGWMAASACAHNHWTAFWRSRRIR